MKLGELANVDNGVLEEFISRANAVLKETGAVTMRKTAEAETNKYLTTNKVATVDSMGTISNELLQDIWPKTNKWRRVARLANLHFLKSRWIFRVEDNIEDSEGSKKLDKEVEREVRAAIKSAGQSLSKKQIGQIRKAAVAYLSFEDSVQSNVLIWSSASVGIFKNHFCEIIWIVKLFTFFWKNVIDSQKSKLAVTEFLSLFEFLTVAC